MNPLSFAEIASYCRLCAEDLDPWEIEAIRALDDAYLEQAAAEAKQGKP